MLGETRHEVDVTSGPQASTACGPKPKILPFLLDSGRLGKLLRNDQLSMDTVGTKRVQFEKVTLAMFAATPAHASDVARILGSDPPFGPFGPAKPKLSTPTSIESRDEISSRLCEPKSTRGEKPHRQAPALASGAGSWMGGWFSCLLYDCQYVIAFCQGSGPQPCSGCSRAAMPSWGLAIPV
jgi:hypothetical protein